MVDPVVHYPEMPEHHSKWPDGYENGNIFIYDSSKFQLLLTV